jgi:hypothetical protein
MPGLAQQMADFGGKREETSLGKGMEEFIDTAILDFTHMTVLIYILREGRDGVSVGQICSVIGDPRKIVQGVLKHFVELGMLRATGGILSKKYLYEREGPRAHLVSKLMKLWKHKDGHEIVLRRVLAPKS